MGTIDECHAVEDKELMHCVLRVNASPSSWKDKGEHLSLM